MKYIEHTCHPFDGSTIYQVSQILIIIKSLLISCSVSYLSSLHKRIAPQPNQRQHEIVHQRRKDHVRFRPRRTTATTQRKTIMSNEGGTQEQGRPHLLDLLWVKGPLIGSVASAGILTGQVWRSDGIAHDCRLDA